jgi:hypothetical protein
MLAAERYKNKQRRHVMRYSSIETRKEVILSMQSLRQWCKLHRKLRPLKGIEKIGEGNYQVSNSVQGAQEMLSQLNSN